MDNKKKIEMLVRAAEIAEDMVRVCLLMKDTAGACKFKLQAEDLLNDALELEAQGE